MSIQPEGPTYSFPAIRGIQAGREYYVTMFPLKLVPRLFVFDEEELDPELRAQRILNKARVPEIARYLSEQPENYVFSSITASIDSEVDFQSYSDSGYARNVGKLTIPMGAQLLINDGQHRRAAIEEALKERPELGNEALSAVLFIDAGLKRSQQMFADLNKHAVRPTRSLGILYDHRDPMAQLARSLAETVALFKGLTEVEKTTISNRSTKLFTLSSIYQATKALLGKRTKKVAVSGDDEELALRYWNELTCHIPEWQLILEKKISASELRRDFIHSHGVALHAFGMLGNSLITEHPEDWKDNLESLSEIDWSRSNKGLWEGRAMVGGRLSKSQNHIILTCNAVKKHLGLKLSKTERAIEKAFEKSE